METKIRWWKERFKGESRGKSQNLWLGEKYGKLSYKSSCVIRTTFAHTAVIPATRATNWHDRKQQTRRAQCVAGHLCANLSSDLWPMPDKSPIEGTFGDLYGSQTCVWDPVWWNPGRWWRMHRSNPLMCVSLCFPITKSICSLRLVAEKQGAESRAALCRAQSSRLTKLQNVTFSFSRATTLCNVIKSYLWMFTFNIW